MNYNYNVNVQFLSNVSTNFNQGFLEYDVPKTINFIIIFNPTICSGSGVVSSSNCSNSSSSSSSGSSSCSCCRGSGSSSSGSSSSGSGSGSGIG